MIAGTLIEKYVDNAAQLLGLELLPEHRPEVVRNFEMLMTQARLFLEIPLDERTEMAPVFHP